MGSKNNTKPTCVLGFQRECLKERHNKCWCEYSDFHKR